MIAINNLTKIDLDKTFLKKVAKIILKGENKDKTELSIVLVSPNRIKKLNKQYRGENRITDVLAFCGDKKFKEGLGEIVLCLHEIKKNARKFNLSFQKELARVLIHGILHLLGYDHEKPSTRAKLGAGPVPHRPPSGRTGVGSKKKG